MKRRPLLTGRVDVSKYPSRKFGQARERARVAVVGGERSALPTVCLCVRSYGSHWDMETLQCLREVVSIPGGTFGVTELRC